MTYDPRLKAVSLFSRLPDEDLERLCEGVTEQVLDPGDTLFTEGEPGDTAYVIAEGDVEIYKVSARREVLLAVRSAGEVIGEMALLQEAPRSASGRARGTVTLLQIPKATLDGVLETSPSAAREMFDVIFDRWRNTDARLRQSERMAQLGTLTAGLAHELNNPAAAVQRGAGQLSGVVADYGRMYAAAVAGVGDARPALDALLAEMAAQAARPPDLDPLERSDRETELEDWLEDRSIERSWELAPALVELGLDMASLETALAPFPDDAIPTVLPAIAATQESTSLVREIEEGSGRLSAIVKALKSYTYLDQAPVQEVDLTTGIDDTLLILKRKLEGITVTRDYDRDLPTIEAYGSELNQVWTNLIDNASDAIREAQRDDGLIRIRAMPADDGVAVEVEDNGPGIPEDVQHRIFDSFFTTKPPGSGTGLGLDISQSIVVQRHGGDITVESEPGKTVFRVELPLRPPS